LVDQAIDSVLVPKLLGDFCYLRFEFFNLLTSPLIHVALPPEGVGFARFEGIKFGLADSRLESHELA
jgi:hypothetical protein